MKLPLHTDLTGRVAVVTGGGGVLCGLFSKALVAAGAKVAVLDLNEAAAQRVVQEAEGPGMAKAFACNVLDRASVARCHQAILTELGPCDILINGAGGNNARAQTDQEFFDPAKCDGTGKTFFDLDRDSVEFVFHLNLIGTLLPTQEFAQDMLGRQGCSILNISSMNAYTPLTKIPAYSGAKAAVSNFTQWLAVYFCKAGIRVNAIAPGFFSTQQNATLLWNPDGSPTTRTEKILQATPMGRFGRPEELLGAMLFLLDPQAASFITGVILPIDGGFSAYRGV